jgi:hypothetical protein
MTSLTKILINRDIQYVNELLDTLIKKIDYKDQVWFNQRQSIWLNEIRIVRNENNYCFKVYVLIVEMLDNECLCEYLMNQESKFIQDNFLLLVKKHLDYYITGLKLLDGGKYTKDDNNDERHIISFVSLISGLYAKM